MEAILNERVVAQIREAFAQLKEPVQLLLFTSKDRCDYCGEVRQLLEEVAAIDARLGLSIHDLQEDAQTAARFNADKAPLIVVAARDGDEVRDLGVQFSGIPSGHEFSTFIHDILLVSGRDSGLGQPAREFLKGLEKPLHLQVFVTPT